MPAEYLQYGGQAVIEGVMMRSPRFFAVSCRAPNQEVVTAAEPIAATWIGRQKWLKKPFLRGTLALLDSLALGIKALQFAAQIQMDEARQGGGPLPEERVRRGAAWWLFWLVILAVNVVAGWFLVPVVGGAIVAKAGSLWAWVRSPRGLIAIGAVVAAVILLFTKGSKKQDAASSVNEMAVGGAMLFGLVFGLVLFVIIPTTAVDAFRQFGWSTMQLNLLDAALRMFIFFDYVAVIGQTRDLFRVFQYHGAEHKAINTYEDGDEVTLESALKRTRLHPRCGTSFIVIVLLLSIAVFAFLPRPEVWLRVPLHLAILFPIAGVAYEGIRLAGRTRSSVWSKIAFAPGLLTQYLTTREPNPRQVEVAVAALKSVMERETAGTELAVT